jgi:hypothetical protein
MRNALDWFVAFVMLAGVCFLALLAALWGLDRKD